TEHHAKVSLAVIKAGVSLLVENALAATVADASRIVDAAKGAGVTLAGGRIQRHKPPIAVAKRHQQEAEYGDLVTLTARGVRSSPGHVTPPAGPAGTPHAEHPRPEGGDVEERARGFPRCGQAQTAAARLRRRRARNAQGGHRRDGLPPNGEARPARVSHVRTVLSQCLGTRSPS